MGLRQRPAVSDSASAVHVLEVTVAGVIGRVDGLDRLTDAKFVTHRTLLDSQAEKVALALNSADKAVNKAEAAVNERLKVMNEFRAALNDAATKNVTRLEFDQMRQQHDTEMSLLREQYNEKISAIAARLNKIEGATMASQRATGLLVAGVGLAITVVVFLANYVFSR